MDRVSGCVMNYSVGVPPVRCFEDRKIVSRVRIQAIGMLNQETA